MAESKNKKEIENTLTWKFQGSEYPQFVTNRTGNVTTTILHPTSGKKLALIGADFAWDDAKPFLDHLDLKLRDEKGSRDDETTRRRANLVSQNARLFRELLQQGHVTKFDDLGEAGEAEIRNREQMLALTPEIQSQIIDDWLGNFHIERYFPEGADDIDSMLNGTDTVWFTAKIGDFKNPAHVLLFEFEAPSPDARRSYEDNTFSAGSKQEGEKMVSVYGVNNLVKLNFARKYFRSVQGSVLSNDYNVDVHEDSIYQFDSSNIESVKKFRVDFTPNWMIRLADQLADAFSLGGK